ncbi:MAG: peptidylprolyl isomerase [Methanoculleus sp.]
MAQAREGDTVRVHYTGRLEDGTVFDSSENRDPLEFTIGDGEVIPGFERAVAGMEPGEVKTATIQPEDSYGPRLDDMTITIDRDQFPADIEPEPGQQFRIQQPDGWATIVTVTRVTESGVTLDANHPLAGQPLTFEIRLIEIVETE